MPGVVGMALNGVLMFSNRAAPGDDIYLEVATFDKCRGHPNTIGYHHHSEPYAITYDDSNFVGVMYDGYPVYGRRDPSGSYPTLDMYGGHAGVTVDSPTTAVYHYHINEQTSTATTSACQKQWFIKTGVSKAAIGTCSGC